MSTGHKPDAPHKDTKPGPTPQPTRDPGYWEWKAKQVKS